MNMGVFMADEPKENLWNKAIDQVEKFDVKVFGAIGGAKGAEDAKTFVEDLRQGHIIQKMQDGLKEFPDIYAHVTGHDKPLERR
jgi:hypothetical protein